MLPSVSQRTVARSARRQAENLFPPATSDNDYLHGLLETLPRQPDGAIDDRWSILAIDDEANRDLLGGLFRLFWDSLQQATSAGEETQRTVIVSTSGSSLAKMATGIGVPCVACETSQGRAGGAAFHPGVLLAASVMGMDIVKLLRGAAAIRERFTAMPLGNNPALDLAVVTHLLQIRRGIFGRFIDSKIVALHPMTKKFSTICNSGSCEESLLIQLVAESVRADRLRVTMPAGENKTIERFLADVAATEAKAARELRTSHGQPTAVIHMSAVDEFSVGQLVQLFWIASRAVEQLAAGN